MLAVDHCHVTGKIRGLLCTRCNVALAAVGDNLEGVMRFVEYLRRAADPIPDSGPDGEPHQVKILRYVTPDGKRAKKGTPGALPVQCVSQTFYVRAGGRCVSLHTKDEGEAIAKVAEMRRRAAAAQPL